MAKAEILVAFAELPTLSVSDTSLSSTPFEDLCEDNPVMWILKDKCDEIIIILGNGNLEDWGVSPNFNVDK